MTMSVSNTTMVTASNQEQSGEESVKMRSTLSAIAKELQRFHTSKVTSNCEIREKNIHEKLHFLQNSLKKKKLLIRKLKADVKIACIIAKTVISAKDNETLSLTNDLNKAKSEAVILSVKKKQQDEDLAKLAIENDLLKEKLDHIYNIIELGYKELQKIRNQDLENIPVPLQMREIIMCCGQYYADYCNKHQTFKQLEQRNSFLNNKVNILNNNLKAMIEELKNVKYQNDKLQSENLTLRDTVANSTRSKYCDRINFSKSENHLKQFKDISVRKKSVSKRDQLHQMEKLQSIDLECHLSLVKKLLEEQDHMLNELKNLSSELNEEP